MKHRFDVLDGGRASREGPVGPYEPVVPCVMVVIALLGAAVLAWDAYGTSIERSIGTALAKVDDRVIMTSYSQQR